MYKNILIPIVFDHEEGIEKSFAAARLLADDTAKITVMHVVETVPGYVRGQIPEETLKQRHDEMQKALADYAAKLDGAAPLLVDGHTGQQIVNFAKENDIDCIVISSHTPSLEKFFLGSTANRVVNHTGCTVVVIR